MERMEKNRLAYCNECEDLVEFYVSDEMIAEEYKTEKISYRFKVGRCKCCGTEVATDIDYNSRKSESKIKAYKKQKGIIDIDEISEIMSKYDVGKETLADIAGFGKVTIKRYYDGFIPAKEYSDVLYKMLNDERFFIESVKKNKSKLKEVAYRKIIVRYERLCEIGKSKLDQIVNYIITHLEEVTPLALEKLLAFSNGVNYAMNGNRLIDEECQAWQHGPVYPKVYNQYKKFGYKPIDTGIYGSHGCLRSLLGEGEIQAIELVLRTFGLYSSKTLEMISHSQEPWMEKRIGYQENEPGNEVIEERSVEQFYKENGLNSEEAIMKYISNCIRNFGQQI
ncbi:MAG: type II toxin-antitoxin system antitoxin SocA domain-containing protein [Lachnospiraceae bacterium]